MGLILKKGKKTKKKKSSVTSAVEEPWMKRGYSAVKKQVTETNNRPKSGGGGFIPAFWIKDGEDAEFRILTEPICINVHRVMRPGKKMPDLFTCLEGTGQVCPLCEAGKTYPRQWQSVYAVIDRRTEKWEDRNGKIHKYKNRVKIWRPGVRIAGLLEKKQDKYGDLRQFEMEISRTGEKFNTTYSFEVGDKKPLTSEEKKARDAFDVVKIIKPKTRAEILRSIGSIEEVDDDDMDDDTLD